MKRLPTPSIWLMLPKTERSVEKTFWLLLTTSTVNGVDETEVSRVFLGRLED